VNRPCRPTHPGADDLITSYAEAIDDYSAGFKTIADAAWATLRPHAIPYGAPADVEAVDQALDQALDEALAAVGAEEAPDGEADVDEAGEYASAVR
jgi:hypothetical protein